MFFVKKILIFIIGGGAYQIIEILWRGFTHPSMFFAGGFCLLTIDFIYALAGRRSLPFTFALCGSVITLVELTVGTVVNVIMDMRVWDYSDIPYNFMGQICPLYTAMWILISIPAVFICKYTDKLILRVFNKNGKATERS